MTTLALTFAPTAPGTARLAAGDGAEDTADKRKLLGLAVPFGVPSEPSMDGYRYQFDNELPDNVDDLIDVVDEHWDDVVVGRLAEPFELTDAGLAAAARIFDTTRGRDLLVETSEGVKTGFSISAEFEEYTQDEDGIRHIGKWTARHLGVVRAPAFTQARGLTLAASRTKEGTPTMTEQTPPVVELPTIAELAAQVAEVLDEAKSKKVHPLARYRSHAHFAAAFRDADEDTRRRMAAEFALVDQITQNNPGVMPPGWRTDIKMNLDKRRPAIAAFGSIGLPDAGMESNWPYFDGDLDGVVAEQAAEKTELHSVRIDIKKANAGIKTAGVASDISYQLLLRSSPSYIAAYQTIMDAAWARFTEAIFEAELLAKGTNSATLLDTTAAKAFKNLLFEGSALVEDATGAPATVALASPDVWLEVAQLDGIENPKYGTQNVAGTSDARTLSVNVGGLEVTRAPFLPARKLVVSNDSAAKFAEQGPMVATEEDVAKLGRNVANWGMYIPAEVYFPAGVVIFDDSAV